ADQACGVLLGQGHDDLPLLVAGPGSSPEAFFKISNSKAWRPTSCSSWAMRPRSWLRRASPSNRSGRRSGKVSRHRARSEGLSWCARQSSAWVRFPVTRSRTTWVLNSAVKDRRGRRAIVQGPPQGPVLHIVLASPEGRTTHIRLFDSPRNLRIG